MSILGFRSLAVRSVLCALPLLILAPSAQALVINYSVDAAAGPFTLAADSAGIISGFSGSVTLVEDVAQTLTIGTLNFSAGNSGAFTGSQSFTVDRTLTINSIVGTLIQNLGIAITVIDDKSSVTGGTTTTLNLGGGQFVDVTPIAYTSPGRYYFQPAFQAPISASFLLYGTAAVPEPASLSLLAIGALSMFGASKRKQDKA